MHIGENKEISKMTILDNISYDDSSLIGESVKKHLKRCGVGVKIRPLAKIALPHMVEIDDYSIIDDFVLIAGGNGVKIGKFVHISSFCSIAGGGQLIMEDFSGLSAGCRIITGSDDFSGQSLTNPCIPLKYKPFLHQGIVRICKHSILGTNSIIHPDVVIGPYAATGSNTVVLSDLDEASVYVGSPARKIGERKKEDMERLEYEIMQDFYGSDA